VVAYAEDDNPYSARFVWTLRFHGHEKAFVLDGGYDKWSRENRPIAMLPTPAPALTDYSLAAVGACCDIRTEGDYVLTRMINPAVVIWDTRRRSEYVGAEVRADRGGRIPEAVHLHWEDMLREVDGVRVLKSEAQIRTLLAEAGFSADKEIIAHCQTGIRSAYATLVLLGLGYERVRNYDGSWIEWANNPELPVVAGEPTAGKVAVLQP
jgi:thiosulfate/3-mercaptopyruvate sulfurtransferase